MLAPLAMLRDSALAVDQRAVRLHRRGLQPRDDARAGSGRGVDGSRRHEDRPGDDLPRLVADLRAHALAGPGTAIDSIGGARSLRAIPGLSRPSLAAGLAGFILLRFLLGLCQCGNYTAGIKALAGLFPASSRSKAGGFFNAGAQFGSVIAPPLVLVLLSRASASAGRWPSSSRRSLVPAVAAAVAGDVSGQGAMTAIALKPAGTAAAPDAASDRPRPQLFGNQQGARAVR